uniref:Uncharacterized protein n=1 Tax=Panagrolaimus davidi TaxID=227884 RepID=A0A914PCM7_9BILA
MDVDEDHEEADEIFMNIDADEDSDDGNLAGGHTLREISLNSSNASRHDKNTVQPIETNPPVKNKRGKPSEYSHQGTAEDLGELKLKAKEEGLTL